MEKATPRKQIMELEMGGGMDLETDMNFSENRSSGTVVFGCGFEYVLSDEFGLAINI